MIDLDSQLSSNKPANLCFDYFPLLFNEDIHTLKTLFLFEPLEYISSRISCKHDAHIRQVVISNTYSEAGQPIQTCRHTPYKYTGILFAPANDEHHHWEQYLQIRWYFTFDNLSHNPWTGITPTNEVTSEQQEHCLLSFKWKDVLSTVKRPYFVTRNLWSQKSG